MYANSLKYFFVHNYYISIGNERATLSIVIYHVETMQGMRLKVHFKGVFLVNI